ncbi:MAG: hypothetical protein IT384_33835 [Deltaproteobacteria bacterium]|nr:hypothetical protein [Deltaproteobacteria bacterium]
MDSGPPIRDFPRSEGSIARRRAVAACLWIAAPAIWLTHLRISHLSEEPSSALEGWALAASTLALALSALGLALRPRLARGVGMLALLGAAAGLGRRAPDAPGVAFMAFAAVAVLGFGLIGLPSGRARPRVRPERVGALWSQAVLLAAGLSLLISGSVLASEIASTELRVLLALQLGAASAVALAGERALAAAGRISARRFLVLALITVVSTLIALRFGVGLALQGARLLYALAWATRERQRRTSVVGIARHTPGLVIFGSFGIAIVVGAMLLSLPVASPRAGGIYFIDALFTATSALCVTGLSVIDVGKDLTLIGQIVLLLLIQVGGLGIMTLSAVVTVALGRGLSGREETLVGESVASAATPATVLRIIRTIGYATLAIEGLGAIALFTLTYAEFASIAEAIWYAIFHAISAFCNAGFGLDATNLERFAERPLVLQVFANLVVLGGLGFGVLYALAQLLSDRLRRRPQRRPLDLHTKVVLSVSAILLVAGAALYLALEWNGVLGRFSMANKLSNAYFQSVVLRTAGFNAIRNQDLGPATVIITILLMAIGGSPGSTAGGIKTTTAAVLFLAVRTVFSRRTDVEAFGRRIDPEVISRSIAITALYLTTVSVGVFLLLLTQPARFDILVFEAFSAIGTVGSTMGATALLDDPGKVVVILLMFLGRVGPLTAASLLSRSGAAEYRLPRGEVNVG